jgi:hypothetical protein
VTVASLCVSSAPQQDVLAHTPGRAAAQQWCLCGEAPRALWQRQTAGVLQTTAAASIMTPTPRSHRAMCLVCVPAAVPVKVDLTRIPT